MANGVGINLMWWAYIWEIDRVPVDESNEVVAREQCNYLKVGPESGRRFRC